MREFIVTILGETFEVEAIQPCKARTVAANLYQDKFGKDYPIGMLMAYSSCKAKNRKELGRKPEYVRGGRI